MSTKKYYSISIVTAPEVTDGFGWMLARYTRAVLQSFFSMSKEERNEKLSQISDEDVKAFYKHGRRVKICVDETMNRKWLLLPRRYKKRAQYFITQALLEKLQEVNI